MINRKIKGEQIHLCMYLFMSTCISFDICLYIHPSTHLFFFYLLKIYVHLPSRNSRKPTVHPSFSTISMRLMRDKRVISPKLAFHANKRVEPVQCKNQNLLSTSSSNIVPYNIYVHVQMNVCVRVCMGSYAQPEAGNTGLCTYQKYLQHKAWIIKERKPGPAMFNRNQQNQQLFPFILRHLLTSLWHFSRWDAMFVIN